MSIYGGKPRASIRIFSPRKTYRRFLNLKAFRAHRQLCSGTSMTRIGRNKKKFELQEKWYALTVCVHLRCAAGTKAFAFELSKIRLLQTLDLSRFLCMDLPIMQKIFKRKKFDTRRYGIQLRTGSSESLVYCTFNFLNSNFFVENLDSFRREKIVLICILWSDNILPRIAIMSVSRRRSAPLTGYLNFQKLFRATIF